MKYFYKIFILTLSLFLVVEGLAFAGDKFYSFRDHNGVIHFSNVKTNKHFKPVGGEEHRPAKKDIKKSHIYRIIEFISKRHLVDASLVKAIAKAESDFDPYAVSRAGAQGVMQLMPQTARSLNVSNPFDPEESIEAGVKHFKKLLHGFDYNVELALAAYNAGRTNVLKYGGIPPFKETRNYVKKVLSYYREFKKL